MMTRRTVGVDPEARENKERATVKEGEMICNVSFKLNDVRVNAMEKAGINSIRGLVEVLNALDLQAVIELEPKLPPPQGRP